LAFLDTHPEGFTIADGGLDELIAASTAFLFEATGTTSHETFLQELTEDRSAGGTLAADTQDRFTGVALFAELVGSEALRAFAARLSDQRDVAGAAGLAASVSA
jgi:ABC-type thiamine transport system substrate-binding protein